MNSSKKILVLVPKSSSAPNVPRDLVYGCWCAGKRIGGISFPPLTSVLIATILKEANIDTEFIDLSCADTNLNNQINNYLAVVLLTSTMTINEDAATLNHLKSLNKHLLTIVWGSHPTFLPKQTLSKKGIDVAIQGEGDYIIRDLLKNYLTDGHWQDTPGIAYKKNDVVISNPPYPAIANLDELPFPDRSLVNKNNYFNPVVNRIPYTTVYTSRGCPGQCTFCTAPAFYGHKIRMRSADNILAELHLIAKLGYKEIFFRDEIFTMNKNRLLAVCSGIKNNHLDLSWICSARVGTIDEEMLIAMKESGCHMIRLGIESGVQSVLDKTKKGISVEETKHLMRLTHKYNMDTHAHMMLGMPGDTKETIRQTIAFAKKINPSIVTFGICTPYPGTKLFKELAQKCPQINDGSDCDIIKLHRQGFFNSHFCDLTENELGNYVKLAYRQFYFRPKYLFYRLQRIRNYTKFKQELKAGLNVLNFVFNKAG